MADARDENRDIIFLQETLLPENVPLAFGGYRAYHLPAAPGQTRGCTILVKTTIPSKEIARPPSCGEGVEVLAVSIQLRDLTLKVYNIYNSPSHPSQLDASEILSLCATAPIFIRGDFNASHEAIGSTRPRN